MPTHDAPLSESITDPDDDARNVDPISGEFVPPACYFCGAKRHTLRCEACDVHSFFLACDHAEFVPDEYVAARVRTDKGGARLCGPCNEAWRPLA